MEPFKIKVEIPPKKEGGKPKQVDAVCFDVSGVKSSEGGKIICLVYMENSFRVIDGERCFVPDAVLKNFS